MPAARIHALPNTFGWYQMKPSAVGTKAATMIGRNVFIVEKSFSEKMIFETARKVLLKTKCFLFCKIFCF